MKVLICYLLFVLWLILTYWTVVYRIIDKETIKITGKGTEIKYLITIFCGFLNPFSFNFLIPIYNLYLFYRNFVLKDKEFRSEIRLGIELTKTLEEQTTDSEEFLKTLRNFIVENGFNEDFENEEELRKFLEEWKIEDEDKKDD